MSQKRIIRIIGLTVNFVGFFNSKLAGKIAFYLFAKPRKGKLSVKHKAFLITSKQEDIENTPHNIPIYIWNKNGIKTILLIHGWESNSARWKPLIKRLINSNYKIIAIDAPAHGQSNYKTFNAILYAQHIVKAIKLYSPFCIVGHSVGGMASVLALNSHINHGMQKMILMGAPNKFEDIITTYSKMLYYSSRVKRGLNNYILKRFGQYPKGFYTAKFTENIAIESLLIHDKNDKIIPFSDLAAIETGLKNSKSYVSTGLGHKLKHEKIWTTCLDFLKF